MEVVREQPLVVCVSGMSRCGTSLTARLLNLCGVYLGPDDALLRGFGSNPEGHWENRPMMAMNERLLGRLGGSWRVPPPLPPGWERSQVPEIAYRTARRLIEQNFDGYEVWGWKDPRNSLTLPFWRQLVPSLRHVICLRNPLDVAASLERRNGMPGYEAFALWLAYFRAALANTEGDARIVVAYEAYFDDWRAQVDRLARFLGLDPSVGGLPDVSSAINDGLRHHRTPPAETFESGRVPVEVASTYTELSRLAADEVASGASGA